MNIGGSLLVGATALSIGSGALAEESRSEIYGDIGDCQITIDSGTIEQDFDSGTGMNGNGGARLIYTTKDSATRILGVYDSITSGRVITIEDANYDGTPDYIKDVRVSSQGRSINEYLDKNGDNIIDRVELINRGDRLFGLSGDYTQTVYTDTDYDGNFDTKRTSDSFLGLSSDLTYGDYFDIGENSAGAQYTRLFQGYVQELLPECNSN